MIKEACIGSYTEAKIAVSKGANRLELCDNLADGGTTPSYGTIALAQKTLKVPLVVMIRPRGGNFNYSDDEFEIMKMDIQICKSLGVYGIAIGIINTENKLNLEKMAAVVALAKPMNITCHMAFDEVENREEALEQLITLGFNRVLTKGGKTSALENMDELLRMHQQAKGRIAILAGGGVHANNYEQLMAYTGIGEVHGTKIVG